MKILVRPYPVVNSTNKNIILLILWELQFHLKSKDQDDGKKHFYLDACAKSFVKGKIFLLSKKNI